MSRALLAVTALIAVLAAGCCGGAKAVPAGQPPRETFAATCGACHTLSDAGTQGQTGPNLDELKPDVDRVLAAIKAGPSVMPAGLLSGADAQRVAEYVARSAGR